MNWKEKEELNKYWHEQEIEEKLKQAEAEKDRKFWKKYTIICWTIMGIIIVVTLILSVASDGSDSTVTCGVCHSEFKSGTSNARSISRTNMCSSCYSNYQYAQDMLGN